MNIIAAFIGAFCVGAALFISPVAAALAAVGTFLMMLAHINTTMGPVIKAAIKAVHAFTYQQNDCVESIQALCVAMIKWRKV